MAELMAPSPASDSRSALKGAGWLIVLTVVVFLAFMQRSSRSVQSGEIVSLHFIGYTNHAGGEKFALLRMTNDSPWLILYNLAPAQINPGTGWPPFDPGFLVTLTNRGVLASHATAILEFPALPGKTWRVPCEYTKNVKESQIILGDVLQLLLKIPNRSYMRYVRFSDEITD